jgi:beta-lactamase class A
VSRRILLGGALVGGAALLSRGAVGEDRQEALRRGLADLEQRRGGRLGVAVHDTAQPMPVAHRGDERFPLCSTHKLLSVGLVLARVDRGQESLTRRVAYGKQDVVTYSPVTAAHAGGDGLTVGEICEAAITVSDNTAANLLLDSFGGPSALTAYLRSIGDPITRLDRQETALNDFSPDDPRDTTTPIAMADLVDKLVVGAALSEASRRELAAWLAGCKTGGRRLRAGLPPGWPAGDKTGSGAHNAVNDVAVVWPPGRAPIVVTAYYLDGPGSEDERSAVLAEVGKLAAAV